MKEITSIHNTYIKSLLKLQEKARERRKTGTFIIEGKREISLAVAANYQFDTILYYPDLISEQEILHFFNENVNRIEISKEVYQKVAYRDSTEGIIAVTKAKEFSLKNIQFKNGGASRVLPSTKKLRDSASPTDQRQLSRSK